MSAERLSFDELHDNHRKKTNPHQRRYPPSSIAHRCLHEYIESVTFDFTGSSGLNLPSDLQKEISELTNLLRKKR